MSEEKTSIYVWWKNIFPLDVQQFSIRRGLKKFKYFLDFTPTKKILLNHEILSKFCAMKKKKWCLIEDSRKNLEKWENGLET